MILSSNFRVPAMYACYVGGNMLHRYVPCYNDVLHPTSTKVNLLQRSKETRQTHAHATGMAEGKPKPRGSTGATGADRKVCALLVALRHCTRERVLPSSYHSWHSTAGTNPRQSDRSSPKRRGRKRKRMLVTLQSGSCRPSGERIIMPRRGRRLQRPQVAVL